jgi:hypothetical protein
MGNYGLDPVLSGLRFLLPLRFISHATFYLARYFLSRTPHISQHSLWLTPLRGEWRHIER